MDLTVNSLVMGSWAILLHRYSGENDVVFGATRACRKSSMANADETIGLFINTVPVRVRLTGEDPVLSNLSVCAQAMAGYSSIRAHASGSREGCQSSSCGFAVIRFTRRL